VDGIIDARVDWTDDRPCIASREVIGFDTGLEPVP
jgi:hypothetical protein